MIKKIKKFKLLLLGVFLFILFGVIPWNGNYFFTQFLLAQSDIEIFEEEVVWNSMNAPKVIDDRDYLFKKGLKVEEGVEILLKNGSRLIVEGDFEVLGTSDQPIIFKGVNEELDNFSISVNHADQTYITNAVFEKGGYYNCSARKPGIKIFQRVFAESCLPKAVLNILTSDELFINNSIFRKNYRSINIQEIGSGSLVNNSFLYNEGGFEPIAIYSKSETVINLKSNCWMRPSGPTYEGYPNGKGEKIEGNFNLEFPQECGSKFKPVILIPGIGGSWNWEVMLENKIAPEGWDYAPATHFYDAWEDALESLGYQKNRDYFVNYYDWRQENSQSVENFLKPTLEKIKEISFDEKYDIVAHSMGGLVTLDYLTREEYQNDIDKVVLQGTPLSGSSKAYPIWSGGAIPEDWSIINVYLKTLSWKAENNGLDFFDLIHKYTPSVKQLLPTFNYIKKHDTGEKVDYWGMEEYNEYLDNLLGEVFSIEFYGEGFNFGDNLLMIQGTGQDTSEIIAVDEYLGENSDKLWLDGQPNPYPLLKEVQEGDGTVLNASSEIPIFETITLDNVGHTDLPSQSIQETGNFLGLNFEDKDYPLNIKEKLLMIFACPIDVKIYDSNENYIDKNQTTIDNAYYYSDGNDDGYRIIEIQNPGDENYSIEITGNGDGEYNSAVYSYSDDGLVDFDEFEGEIQQDEKRNYSVVLNNQDVGIEEIIPDEGGSGDDEDGDSGEEGEDGNSDEDNDENSDDNNTGDDENQDENSPEADDPEESEEGDDGDDSSDVNDDENEDEEEEDQDEDEKDEKDNKDKKDRDDKVLGYIKNREKKEELNQKQIEKKDFIEDKKIAKKEQQNQRKDKTKVAGEKIARNNPWIIGSMILVGAIALLLTWTVGREENFIKKYFK